VVYRPVCVLQVYHIPVVEPVAGFVGPEVNVYAPLFDCIGEIFMVRTYERITDLDT
jgi:hypothetical protein